MTRRSYRDIRVQANDGLLLHARSYGDTLATSLPVICLPGLARHAGDFHDIAMALTDPDEMQPRHVVAVDYRGRGLSGYDPDPGNYSVPVETSDLLTLLAHLGISRGIFIGTSRGGIITMGLSGAKPGMVTGAVLNDIGPVIEGAGLAQIRAYAERAPKPKSFDEAASILKAAQGAAFAALSEDDWQRMAHAIYREENGRPVVDFDPALVKTLKGIDFNTPLPVFWPQFLGLKAVPVLAIRGSNSMLLSAETLRAMKEHHPRLETVTVDGQGHAPMLETDDLPARIGAFLERCEGIQ